MIIQFAVIRFYDQKGKKIAYHISDIRKKVQDKENPGTYKYIEFSPDHAEDFDKKAWYYAKWTCEDSHCPKFIKFKNNSHHHFFKAVILNLGATKEEALKKSESTRCKFPRKDFPTSTSPESSESSTDLGDESSYKRVAAKRIKEDIMFQHKQKHFLNKRQRIIDSDSDGSSPETLQSNCNGFGDRQLLSINEDASHENSPCPMKSSQISGGSRNRSSPRPPLQSNSKARSHYGTPRRPLRNIDECSVGSRCGTPRQSNNTIQRVPSIIRSIKKKYRKSEEPKFNLDTMGKRHEIKDGQRYLGLDVFVDETSWAILQMQKKPFIYLRDLADNLWGPIKLVNRCIRLPGCKVLNINPSSPRKELEKDRLQLLTELFEEYLKKNKGLKRTVDRQVYLSSMNSILKQKIQDLRTHFKNVGKTLESPNPDYLLDERIIEKYNNINKN